MATDLTILLEDADATTGLAQALAPLLQAGDTLLLEGPIGAGKSHFARSLITAHLAAHGAEEDIPSPTFTLVQTYQAGPLEIWHCDLYRLSSSWEAEELGLFEAFDTALCLVEWPDRLGPDAPGTAALFTFAPVGADSARRLDIRLPDGPFGTRLARRLATYGGADLSVA